MNIKTFIAAAVVALTAACAEKAPEQPEAEATATEAAPAATETAVEAAPTEAAK